jgi:hypothetical protein
MGFDPSLEGRLVRSNRLVPLSVIPAKVLSSTSCGSELDPRFRGGDEF